MDLFNKEIIYYPGADIVRQVLLDGNSSFISYEVFEVNFKNFIKEIMNNYLSKLDNFSSTCGCIVDDMSSYKLGIFMHNCDSDVLKINRSTLKDIYNNDRLKYLLYYMSYLIL